MNSFIFYNSLGFVFSAGMFTTLEFISNPSDFRTNMNQHIDTVKFWAIDKVVSIYSLYKDMFPTIEVNKAEEIDGLIYNKNGELCDVYSENLQAIYEKRIINEKEYFVKNHINDPKPNNIFMGCELNYIDNGKDNKLDINNELEKFCVTNLKLDKLFMKAFMKKVFDINLGDEYTLNCITTNCDILTINEKQILHIHNDSYDVKECEEI